MKRNPSSTKRGPGRRHVDGEKKPKPQRSAGASSGFVQRINPLRQAKKAARKVAA